jgi:hypothetical protein
MREDRIRVGCSPSRRRALSATPCYNTQMTDKPTPTPPREPLRLPPNGRDVTAEKIGTVIGIVGATAAKPGAQASAFRDVIMSGRRRPQVKDRTNVEATMAKYTKVTVVLIENSSRGNLPQQFDGQLVEIDREPTITKMSVDGQLSIGELPTHVLWKEGRASQLQYVTGLKITTSDDRIIVEGALKSTFNWPRDTTEGVSFDIL